MSNIKSKYNHYSYLDKFQQSQKANTFELFNAWLPGLSFRFQNKWEKYIFEKHDVSSVKSVRQYCKSISPPIGETSTDSFLFLLPLRDATITHLATSQIIFDQAALFCQCFRPCQSIE